MTENNKDQKKTLPHDAEAEQAVISSMISDVGAAVYAHEHLVPSDFYRRDFQIIFSAISDLIVNNERIDIITLNNELEQNDVLKKIGGKNFIIQLANNFYTSANLKQHVKIIQNKSILRRIIKISSDMVLESYNATKPAEAILEEAEKNIFDLIQNKNTAEFVLLREILVDVIDRIEKVYQSPDKITGLPTGFYDFDNKTSGLQNSDLILIAARPSMGKTAFALNIAENVALNQNKAVAIFSLEMSKYQLANRLLCSNIGLDAQTLRTGRLTQKNWADITKSLGVLSQAKIFIDDTPGITSTQLRAKSRKLKIEKDISIIIIDYLQLMSGSNKSANSSRQQEISEISRALKSVARELDVPIIALSQLSRACEARSDHRPMLSDLRESGAIEQDADIVAFLYRDEYYNPETEKKNVAELIIAKQRNGPTGTIELLWSGSCTRFMNIDKSF